MRTGEKFRVDSEKGRVFLKMGERSPSSLLRRWKKKRLLRGGEKAKNARERGARNNCRGQLVHGKEGVLEGKEEK